jgi:nucleotide-binding universal stress UspA family protein
MRSILVYADHGAGMPARLETALTLARAMRGHVTALIDTPIARFMAMDAVGGSYLAVDAVEQAVARDKDYAHQLTAQLMREDVPFDVLRGEDEPAVCLSEASRLCDVIVLSRDCGFAAQVAVEARTPVLIVPDDTALTLPLAVVAVAWNSSYEAATALRGALPLLKSAGEVHLVSVGQGADSCPALEAAQYLARHGIKAQVSAVDRVGSVEESLAAAVARLQASLVVMGAFGHSRLREFIMGGVTRYFLELKEGPAILLGH